jgi:hypothetical protein
MGRAEIELAMKTAGLPTLATVYAGAKAALDLVPGRLARDPTLAAIRGKLMDAGRKLHQEPEFDAPTVELCPSGGSPAPLLCDSECDVLSFGAPPLDLSESEFLYDCHERYRKVLRMALRAARGLEFELTDFVY